MHKIHIDRIQFYVLTIIQAFYLINKQFFCCFFLCLVQSCNITLNRNIDRLKLHGNSMFRGYCNSKSSARTSLQQIATNHMQRTEKLGLIKIHIKIFSAMQSPGFLYYKCKYTEPYVCILLCIFFIVVLQYSD